MMGVGPGVGIGSGTPHLLSGHPGRGTERQAGVEENKATFCFPGMQRLGHAVSLQKLLVIFAISERAAALPQDLSLPTPRP